MSPPGQTDMFRPLLERAPVIVAYGAGLDSTGMIAEMHARGEPIDQVLFADTGSEKPETYEYLAYFKRWLNDHSIPFEVLSYQARDFKHFPPYKSLLENCLTNGTLPSIAFGFSSCSKKFKQSVQDNWTNSWEPATTAWAQGLRVVKCIGYDCSPADLKRYAQREGYRSDKYEFRYPLREWGWTRDRIAESLRAKNILVPPKSACFFCTASKTHEVDALPKNLLRLIVLMEARAEPRLTTTEGLWRKTVKGTRGGTAKPGSMTIYIREKGLLPSEQVDLIRERAPQALIRWQAAQAEVPIERRPALSEWLEFFEAQKGVFEGDGVIGPIRAVSQNSHDGS